MGLFAWLNSDRRAQARRRKKDVQWLSLASRLERRFQREKVRREAAEYFENLYVERDDTHRFVELRLGQHLIAPAIGRPRAFDLESGAKLQISQSVRGDVAVILHPYRSNRLRRLEEHIVWGIYNWPRSLWRWRVELALGDFFRYVDVSSARRDAGWFARTRIDYLVFLDGLRTAANRHTSITRVVKGGAWIVGFIGFLSALATLGGTSVPQIWALFHPAPPAGKMSTASTSPVSASSRAPASAPTASTAPVAAASAMPLITGYYTFCPADPVAGPPPDPKLLNFLYDLRQAAGKVAFLDVEINVSCKLPPQPPGDGEFRTFDRNLRDGAVEYVYHVPAFDLKDHAEVDQWLSQGRDAGKLNDLYADNGSFVTVRGDKDGRNAITQLTPNAEGEADIIYGPYLIKAGGEDAFMTLDLTAPVLDSAMQAAATAISAQRHETHEKEITALPVSTARPAPASSPATGKVSIAVPERSPHGAPLKLPPLTPEALKRLPPLPSPMAKRGT